MSKLRFNFNVFSPISRFPLKSNAFSTKKFPGLVFLDHGFDSRTNHFLFPQRWDERPSASLRLLRDRSLPVGLINAILNQNYFDPLILGFQLFLTCEFSPSVFQGLILCFPLCPSLPSAFEFSKMDSLLSALSFLVGFSVKSHFPAEAVAP
jgi:hypothetical protein